MKLAGKTDVGRVRQENQDDYRAGELPAMRLGCLCATVWAVHGADAKLRRVHATSLSAASRSSMPSVCPARRKRF